MKERFKLVAVVHGRLGGVERFIFKQKIGPCSKDEAIRIATEAIVRKETRDASEYWLVPLPESDTHSHRILAQR